MKIKIIANKPQGKNCSDISEYIGQDFDAIKYSENEVMITIDGHELFIFNDEYEVIED